jgi:ribosomal protein S6
VTSAAGTVKNVERMGKRRLAYMVRKFREGVYILMTIEGAGTVIHELERRLRVTEPVIKFLTVRIDEEQKRLDKIKKLRDARKKVSAQPAPQSWRKKRPRANPRRKLRQRRRKWSVHKSETGFTGHVDYWSPLATDTKEHYD